MSERPGDGESDDGHSGFSRDLHELSRGLEGFFVHKALGHEFRARAVFAVIREAGRLWPGTVLAFAWDYS